MRRWLSFLRSKNAPRPVSLLLALVLLLAGAAPSFAQQLTIQFLDVGQGDAAWIVTPEGRRVLIDAGPAGARVMERMKAGGIESVDLVIASHNHADHIGGMPEVLNGIRVDYYLDNGLGHATRTYELTAAVAEAKKIKVIRAESRVIELGKVKLRILGPPPELETQGQNNSSVGVLLEYGQFRALWTGDSEEKELQYWLQHESVPPVQVLKVAHHGSPNGTTDDWIRATRPLAAVISVGPGNTYGHPNPMVVRDWSLVAARVYRTDVDGDILITADSTGRFMATAMVKPKCTLDYHPTRMAYYAEGSSAAICG